ncbi:PTS fructose transporter subunit IIC [Enorma phocaeensis]|uniref:PTS fructose transporter subunit IIBC n=1 Tax=Enorma phocaeensis TaxID=1871019 RepID=A0ABT7V8M7_9ACTN|nr:PTS fructose transporter subunit IIBC [Enorma phocaeensis]MDM8274851.1 PTS fructose transporter subunit IIBC [Enorma phocaeensis]
MKIVAVCACTVGIAHTYMAKNAIEEECKKRGFECKVEAQGGLGIENSLSQEDVDSADIVINAIDVGIEGDDRFDAKRAEDRFLKVGTADAISDAAKVIDQAVEMAKKAEEAAASGAAKKGLFADFGKTLLNAFNTGVSYFIPVVVIGGVFLAFSLATGEAGDAGMTVTNPFFQNLNTIGSAGIAMMIPVLAAYIAYSIAGKPGLAPGFVLGYLVNNPVTIDGTDVSTGFLGAMIMAVFAGYFVKWMKTWKVNSTIQTIMPVLIIPILSSLVLGLFYIYVLATPISIFMGWLIDVLGNLQGGSAVVLGVVIGVMTAFDMGGPINKTASTFTMALMAEQIYAPNGMFRVAVAIPPIACGLAALIARNKFDEADRQMGISALFMGCIGITEGAIPFAVKDLVRTLPGICIGSAVGAGLAAIQGIQCFVPHGGFIVALATNNIPLFCLDIVIGSVVAAVILIAMKPKLSAKADA